jgi:hypothetical protein
MHNIVITHCSQDSQQNLVFMFLVLLGRHHSPFTIGHCAQEQSSVNAASCFHATCDVDAPGGARDRRIVGRAHRSDCATAYMGATNPRPHEVLVSGSSNPRPQLCADIAIGQS